MSEYDYKTLYTNNRPQQEEETMLQSGRTLRNRLPSGQFGNFPSDQRSKAFGTSSHFNNSQALGAYDKDFGFKTTSVIGRQKPFDPYNSELTGKSRLQNVEDANCRYSYRSSVERLRPTLEYNRRDKVKADLSKIELERLLKENIELKMKLENVGLEQKRAAKMQLIEYEYKIKQVERENKRLEEDLKDKTSSEERQKAICKELEEQTRNFKAKIEDLRDQLNFNEHKLEKYEYENKRLASENNDLIQLNDSLKIQNADLIEFTLYSDAGDRELRRSNQSNYYAKMSTQPISQFGLLHTPKNKKSSYDDAATAHKSAIIEKLHGLANLKDIARPVKTSLAEIISSLKHVLYDQEQYINNKVDVLIENFDRHLEDISATFKSKVEISVQALKDIEMNIERLYDIKLDLKVILNKSDGAVETVTKRRKQNSRQDAELKEAFMDVNRILKNILGNTNNRYESTRSGSLILETLDIARYIEKIIQKPDTVPNRREPVDEEQLLKFKLNCTSIDLNEIRSPIQRLKEAPIEDADEHRRCASSDEYVADKQQKNISFNTLVKNFVQPKKYELKAADKPRRKDPMVKNECMSMTCENSVQCDILDSDMKNLKLECEEQKNRTGRLNSQLETQEEELNRIRIEREAESKDIEAYQSQIEHLNKINENYLNKFNELNERLTINENEFNAQIESKSNEYAQHIKTLQENLVEANTAIKQRDQQMRQVELTKNQLLAQLDDMTLQLQSVQRELEEYKTTRLQDEVKKATDNYDQDIKSYTAKIEQLYKRINQLESTCKELQKDNENHDNILESEVQKQENREMISIDERKLTVNTKTNEIIMDGNVIPLGDSHLSSISAKISTTKVNQGGLRKSQSEKLMEQDATPCEDENEYEVEIQVFIRELLEAHKRKVLDLEQEIKHCKKEFRAKEDALNDLKIRFQKLKIENHSIQKLKHDNNMLLDKLDEKEEHINTLNENLKALKHENEGKVSEGNGTLSKSKENGEGCKELSESAAVELRKKNIELMEENLELTDQIDEVQKENEDLHEKIKVLEAEIEDLQVSMPENDNHKVKDCHKLESSNDKQSGNNQKKIDEMVTAVKEKDELIGKLEKMVELQHKEISALKTTNNGQPESHTSLENSIKIKQLEDVVSDLRATIESQKKQLGEYEEEIDNLQNILTNFNEERNEYLDKIQRISSIQQQTEQQAMSSARNKGASPMELFMLKLEVDRLSNLKENVGNSKVINYSLDSKNLKLSDSKI